MAHLIDKSALVAEIARWRDICKKVVWDLRTQENKDYYQGKAEAYKEALSLIDTLEVKEMQEEPVSEDLEDAVNAYMGHKPDVDECSSVYGKRQAFKAGAHWQEEQFEKNRLAHCDALTKEQAQIESDFVTQHLKENNRTPTFIDAIEYGMALKEKEMQSTIELAEDHAMLAGMQKMKEDMVAKAIDGVITFDYYSGDKIYGCIAHDSFCLEDFGLKDRNKVKVLVIKEE